MNTWAGLTRWQYAAMSETQRTARRVRWAGIVAHLAADHYARYQAPTEARIAEWAQTRRAS